MKITTKDIERAAAQDKELVGMFFNPLVSTLYEVQKGKLTGGYKTVYKTVSEAAAKRAFGHTIANAGEAKRLLEVKRFANGDVKKRRMKLIKVYFT